MEGNNYNNPNNQWNLGNTNPNNNYSKNNQYRNNYRIRNLNPLENETFPSEFNPNFQRNKNINKNNYRNNFFRNGRNENFNVKYEKNSQNIDSNNLYKSNEFKYSENNKGINSEKKIHSVLKNNFRNNKFKNEKEENQFCNHNNLKKEENKIDISKLDQREFLIHELKLNRYECMICMNVIEKHKATWSCEHCYHLFHLQCIKKWANSNDNKDENELLWRCPICQTENNKNKELFYTCFCQKQMNPIFKFGTIAHSCSDVCSKRNQKNVECPHLCSLLCHPGACPPCEASKTRQCHCGRTQITGRCIADESQFHCESICDQILNCGLHKCEEICHLDNAHACDIIIKQKCWCSRTYRDVVCGSKESKVERFNCEEVCNLKKNCGNHNCELLCHEGKCEKCELLPDNVKYCFCGKMTLEQLSVVRKNCLDPIPSCKRVCGKLFNKCGHTCKELCHEGKCKPCTGTMKVKCVCQSTFLTVECSSYDAPLCKQRCQAKLLCNRHRCNKLCCDLAVHICPLECGRILSCKEHRCDNKCGHQGLCQKCPNVSFDELFCECGITFTLPPIECGQKPPFCRQLCSREHPCNHQIRHNCHKESKCPPCTELVNKFCPGNHVEYYNIPCFQPMVTCGRVCDKALPNCNHKCLKNCHIGECLENNELCKQPCTKIRKGCEHSCGVVCHENDCDIHIKDCEHIENIFCKCRLRQVLLSCSKIKNIKDDELLLAQNDLYKVSESDILEVNCDSSCVAAIKLCQSRNVCLSAVNKTTEKYKIDPSLSCFQKCITTCHNSNNADKACNSSSYICIQKYYAAYLEEFTRFNLNFVISLERIFKGFHLLLLVKESNKCVHYFHSISTEKSQFINRFSTVYRLICFVSKNEDGTKNVIVKADINSYCNPKNLLSKRVEEKYFKMSRMIE